METITSSASEAIEVATKLVNAAIAATEADPTFISPVTGRGELVPYLMAKVVDTQYSLAVWLFEKAHTWTRRSPYSRPLHVLQ